MVLRAGTGNFWKSIMSILEEEISDATVRSRHRTQMRRYLENYEVDYVSEQQLVHTASGHSNEGEQLVGATGSPFATCKPWLLALITLLPPKVFHTSLLKYCRCAWRIWKRRTVGWDVTSENTLLLTLQDLCLGEWAAECSLRSRL